MGFRGKQSGAIGLGPLMVAMCLVGAVWGCETDVVTPVAPLSIEVSPRDTTVFVGGTFRLRIEAPDPDGRDALLSGGVALEVDGDAVSVDETGAVFGRRIGRARVIARGGSVADTVWVTVPPKGTLAAYYSHRDGLGPAGIATVETDGSGFTLLFETGEPYFGIWPDWKPGGEELVFEVGGVHEERLYVLDPSGNATRATSVSASTKTEIFGGYSRDWLYFSARGSAVDNGTGIWRVRNTGGDPERVGPNPSNNANNWQSSASPDGLRLVYNSVNAGLSVLDVATGQPTKIRDTGLVPRWSPVSDWIVFNPERYWSSLDDSVSFRLMRADGSSERDLARDHLFIGRADWSPDGEWLVARQSNYLSIVHFETGVVLPLPWSGRLSSPAWKK